ncbi:MAG: hypothetical protein HPY85_08610 [Anaerolineae bacterium]|nr:hypothetical protein [Anaerolineae bacterium]
MKLTHKLLFFTINIVLFLLIGGCSLIGSQDQSAEIDMLSDQIAALSTQNALLVQSMNADDNTASGSIGSQSTTPTEQPTPVVVLTPTRESLPTEPVMAGKLITYDGWSLMVSENFGTDSRGNVYITTYVKNLEDNDRVFRYTNAAIKVFDDLGNEFKAASEKCLYDIRNLTIDGEEQSEISSFQLYTNCATPGFAYFIGPIPLESGHLIVHFENFGPFTGIDVIIDL